MLRFKNARPKEVRTVPAQRLYVIGDVHGRYDLLQQLIKKIISHWEMSKRDFKSISLIFLGDIIDRGPDSEKCLSLVEKLTSTSGAKLILGNHEDLLLRSMEGDRNAQQIWLENGGLETIKSFGVTRPTTYEDSFDFGERLCAAIPSRLVTMLKNAKTHISSGDYFFVHAGVRPNVPLRDQTDFDKFFIREEFTAAKNWHGALIVHGHSIVDDVEIHPNRIAIDTGAYRTGRLSAICLQDDWHEIIST